jgi:hypothetical protein
MTRTRRQRIVAASCAALALVVLGVVLVVWQARQGAKESNPFGEDGRLLDLLPREMMADIAKGVDLDNLVAEWRKRGGADLETVRATLQGRFDAYFNSPEFLRLRDEHENRMKDLLRDEKLRALILGRLKDQPLRLESTQTVIVR